MTRIQKIYKNIFDITPEFINKHNIKGMLVDMDNTLLPWHETTIDDDAKQWIQTIKNCDVKICVITNSGIERTSTVMKDMELDYIHSAFKPFPFAFIRARKLLNIHKKNILVVGDQMVTDGLGSKLMGFNCVIVDPISPKEQKGTYINRFFERLIFKRDVRDTYDDK